ncbi:MAG: HAD hydrolase-like protein [Gemmatimonadales bacterium]
MATGDSAIATFMQSAPRLFSLLHQMRPTWQLPALQALDAAFVERHAITGIIWDVDGTLTGDRRPALAPEVEAPFQALRSLSSLRHVVLSNAGEVRYLELGRMFPRMPILRAYTLGEAVLFRRLLNGADTWTSEELRVRLAEGARVIRKPSGLLVEYAVRELGGMKEGVLMVGDQHLTDIAGANLTGVRSVKLPTLAPESFRRSVRISQRIEALLYTLLY